MQHSGSPGAYAKWEPLADALVSTFSGAATACLTGNAGHVPASGATALPGGFTLPPGTPAAVRIVLVGTPVYGMGQLVPGDLLFSAGSDGTAGDPGHVGMYIGSGLVIEAPQTGEPVMVTPLAGYWQQNTVAIRRIA